MVRHKIDICFSYSTAMKKMMLLFLFVLSVYANEAEQKDLLEYSNVNVHDYFSFYAARMNMQCFQSQYGYSIGLIFHDEKQAYIDFALGYMQPSERVEHFLYTEIPSWNTPEKDEGLLFFLNYRF